MRDSSVALLLRNDWHNMNKRGRAATPPQNTHSSKTRASLLVEKGHGRIETRRCEVFEKGLIIDAEHWKKLSTVIKRIFTFQKTKSSVE